MVTLSPPSILTQQECTEEKLGSLAHLIQFPLRDGLEICVEGQLPEFWATQIRPRGKGASLKQFATFDTWYGDIDLGEMFLNYSLDEQLRSYARVDATTELRDQLQELYKNEPNNEKKRFILRCERNLMEISQITIFI